MKKLIFVLGLFLALTLFGCSKVYYGLSQGTYIMEVEEGAVDVVLFARPQITFDMDKRMFTARASWASSYLARGEYEIDEGYVTAKTYDGLYTYVFEIVDNEYIKLVQKKYKDSETADDTLLKYAGDLLQLGEAFDGEVNTFEGMSMNIVQGSVYEEKTTIEIMNTSGEKLYGGNQYDYRIQSFVDGTWYELEGEAFPNTDEALLYDGTVTQRLNWFSRYGNLPAGTYRVVKNFFPLDNVGKDFMLAAEFEILGSLEDIQQKGY